ncbi:hypothetical protein HGP28_16395 [Vibrio sp. SM6]|uniref:HTH luxR-type domain-containing protein n=1 Tax=Vibrio agarilyticus TaxID=2726741 RepID=A0A7X8TTC9_9VIBR|nr:LuxR C-terminal-related transcriptional regulator [Vibrio agarilyticus]NLS14451.1 hypothetical protein [Vibrio agarilyticus]
MQAHKDLKEKLYKTINNVEHWRDVLGEMVKLTGAKKAFLMLRNRQSSDFYIPKDLLETLASPVIYGLSEQEVDDYVNRYQSLDPWTKIEAQIPPITPYALSQYISAEALRASGFWSWLEPQGVNDTVVFAVHHASDHWVSVNLLYDNTQPGLKQKILALITEYLPLMNEVWEAGQRMRQVTTYPASIQFFLEQLSDSAFLVDRYAKVINSNRHAKTLAKNSELGLQLHQGYLHHKERRISETLKKLISNIGSEDYHPDAPPKLQVRLLGHNVTVTLLNRSEDLIGYDTALRLVTIEMHNARGRHGLAPPWQHDSLTKREAELVEVLASGGKIIDFIHQYGLAKSTAHAHWGNVKKKLCVSDRSEIYAAYQMYLRQKDETL